MRVARPLAISLAFVLAVFLLASCAAPDIETAGYTWSLQHELEDFNFWDVSALDGENVWAVGFDRDYNGSAYYFNGKHWTKAGSFEGKISTVSALDRKHVWAAGDGIYFFDGKSWREQHQPEEVINGISAVDQEHVWAVGDRGGIYFFNGSSWTKQFQARGGTLCVSAIDPEHVWAVGQGEDLLFYNGSTWDRQLDLLRITLFSVFGADDDQVWMVGGDEWIFPVYESTGGYPHTGHIALFDGSSWERVYRADETLFDISAPDRDHVWAAGQRHVYYHDGSSWEKQFSYEMGIYSVSAPDPEHVWVVGGPRIYSGKK